MTKVSIIVPFYNAGMYLDRAITSLLNQSYREIEVILVDDGSTDNSYEIVSSYAQKDSRICLFYQENKGSAAARNFGMKQAHGEYLMFLDADDSYREDCVEKAYQEIEESGSDVVVFGSEFLDEDGATIKTIIPKRRRNIALRKQKEVLVEIENCPWDKIYKRELIQGHNIRFPEGLYYEDLEFTFLVLLHAKDISFLDEILVEYTVERKGNVTHDMSEHVLDMFQIVERILKAYREENLYATYEEELKAISIINIVDKMKQVIWINDEKLRDSYITKAYAFLSSHFGKIASKKYDLKKHRHDFIYFHPLLLKIYMILKGRKR